VHELASPKYALDHLADFGRDLSPADVNWHSAFPQRAGPPIDPDALAWTSLSPTSAGIHSIVLSIDRFGNIGLNLDRSHLDEAGVAPGTASGWWTERYYAVARTPPTHGGATSSCTRTRTGTSRSRSTAAARRTCWRQGRSDHLDAF
jgi:hypothetical protein